MIGGELITKLDADLNTDSGTPSGTNLVKVRPLLVERSDGAYGDVSVTASVSASSSTWGRSTPQFYDGNVRVEIFASTYDVMTLIGNRVRATLDQFAGMLGTAYRVLSIRAAGEALERDEDDNVTTLVQNYTAQWVVVETGG